MKVLARRALSFGIAAYTAALALFGAVAALRLGPKITGPHLPMSLIWPFARPLLAAGLEVAFLVSAPIALGLAVAGRRVGAGAGELAKGENGAASVPVMLVVTLLLLVVLGVPSFAASSWLEGRGSSPGELATELVVTARRNCVDGVAPARVGIPILGFSWVCEAGRAPRLQGQAPIGRRVTFDASAIQLGDDLKRIALEGLELAFPLPPLNVQVRARRATLTGLPPWGRSRRFPLALRMMLITSSAGLSALGLAWLLARRPWVPTWARAMFGVSSAFALWWAVARGERQDGQSAAYFALPVTALLTALASLLVLLAIEHWRGRREREGEGPSRGV